MGAGGAGGFGGIGGGATVNPALARLLETGASRYRWAAATQTSDTAASMELASGGVPVMALGGFRGSDPGITLAGFEKLVAQHEVHYYVGGGGGFGGDRGGGGFGGGGGGSDAAQIAAWVEAHFTAQNVGGMTVYNLTAPNAG